MGGRTSLEEKIHSFAISKDVINTPGINNFIINYVNMYDNYLSSYIASQLAVGNDLISGLKKDITKVLNRWDIYEKNNYERKIDINKTRSYYLYDNNTHEVFFYYKRTNFFSNI